MGNDVADINHDGWPDLISLDMLPEDEKVLKSSEGDDNIGIQKMRIEQFGYHYQFTRNMLFINQPNSSYAETALLSGVAATDWSWSALFADYNQDGEQDIFISNGIVKRPNDLDFINFVSNDQINTKIENTKLVDQKAIQMMPSGATHNYVYEGSGDLTFKDQSASWITKDTLVSGATAWADLDLDGDLDVVTNNINTTPTLYINKTDKSAAFLKIKFNYTAKNPFGIGTKVFSYHQGKLQYKELYTVRGFQASSEPIIHFGYGNAKTADSLKIVWPNKTVQILKNVTLNKTLTITPKDTKPFNYNTLVPKGNKLFNKIDGNLGINFTHKEDLYLDFDRQKLIPYRISDRGPATAVGDLNEDGREDLFFGGSKLIPPKVYLQTDSTYVEQPLEALAKDAIQEQVTAIITDFNGDDKDDLFVGTAGADFFNTMAPLKDSYYVKTEDNGFSKQELPAYFDNASVLKTVDFDKDGDLDVFVGNLAVSNDFGKLPTSYLLENTKGTFTIMEQPALDKVGMVTDAIWIDFDNDTHEDLILVGEWMAPKFLRNKAGRLEEVSILEEDIKGLWQKIIPFDIDADGDMDLVLGNWGTNSKFIASENTPLKMFYADFDDNGNTETIVATAKGGAYYPIESFNGLSSQLVSLRKKFTDYSSFAGKTVKEILGEEALKKAQVLEVTQLKSGYLENTDGRFSFVSFANSLQMAPITAFLAHDFDSDGNNELLVAGNYFGVKPYHGRLGSFSGALINTKDDIILGSVLGLNFIHKSARDLHIITLNAHSYLLATFNNDDVQLYDFKNK